jgi:flavodoxin I
MRHLVVYDSAYGNTADIAAAVAGAISSDTLPVPIGEVTASALPQLDLLLVGSPTQGGRPTPAMIEWIRSIPPNRLSGVAVAAFDTRLEAQQQGFALRLLMGIIGFAAPRMLDALEQKGGRRVAEPEGFIVGGKEGPLNAGERQRAKDWARQVALRVSGQDA